MEPGVWEIFGTRYYTHGFGLVFVAPFALWFAFSLLKTLERLLTKTKPVVGWGLVLSAALTVAMTVGVFWDVYHIGQQATKLCKKQGGLHVYRTVEAEGVLGLSDIEYWSKFGLKFVEYDLGHKKLRFYLQNGKENRIEVESFVSNYKITSNDKKISNRIEIHSYKFVNMQSDEVLGESIVYAIDGGWADMVIYNILPIEYSPWLCSDLSSNYIGISQLVLAVVKQQ